MEIFYPLMQRSKSTKTTHLLIWLTIGVFVLGGVGYFASRIIPLTTPLGINEITNASGTVDLALTPATLTTLNNADSTLILSVNTNGSRLASLNVTLKYDPTYISTPTVQLDSFLSNVLTPVSVNNGTIQFVLGASPESGGATGTGNIATVAFRTIKNGTTTFTIDSTTSAWGMDASGTPIFDNLLRSIQSATLTINTPTSNETSVSPSPSPSPSPITQSPTPSPTQTTISVVTTTPRPTTRSTPRPTVTSAPTPDSTLTTAPTEYIPIPPEATPLPDSTESTPTFFQKIFLGWKIIFQYLYQLIFG